jgi:hypothetical protein
MNSRMLVLTLLSIGALLPLGAFAQVDAGESVTLECATEKGTEYTLNGTVPEDDSVVFEWSTDPLVALEGADTVTPTGVFALGVTTATLTATVGLGTPESDSTTVTVEDTRPPVIRVKAEPRYLWPPNHEMHEVEIKIRAEDACSGEDDLEVELIGATSNEPDNGTGDGNTVDDIQGVELGTDDRSVLLRAERSGSGDGRIYTLTYRVTDSNGNRTEAETMVYVPHDESDLKDWMDDDKDEMEPICRPPLEAVEAVVDLFPGLGSVRNETSCHYVCKSWTRACGQVATGSARCAHGEGKALGIIEIAECRDSDDRGEMRECVADAKIAEAKARAELRRETTEARDLCAKTGQRCHNVCDDVFGEPVTLPVEDE